VHGDQPQFVCLFIFSSSHETFRSTHVRPTTPSTRLNCQAAIIEPHWLCLGGRGSLYKTLRSLPTVVNILIKNGFAIVQHRSPGREPRVPAGGEASGLHQYLVPRRRRFVSSSPEFFCFCFYQLILFVVFNI
jgi:hypothetical protein